MQGGTVRLAAAGFLAVVILSALGPSMAAAVEAAEDQPPPAAQVRPIEPASQPDPLKAPPQVPPPEPTPPPHPTPKPKPAPTPKPTQKPKPMPTPVRQSPGNRPSGQTPGDPKPVRSDEPPTAPVTPAPAAAAPAGPPDRPGGGAGSSPIGPGASIGPPSRVHLVVAGATVSGIAAVAGWLVLGGRRHGRPSQRPLARIPQVPPTTVTLADGMQLDLEVVVNRPDGAPQPRYTGRVPGTAATTLWTDDDDRPRWIRRFDEQGPARPRAPRSSLGVEDRDKN
jgi:hypothetical protein